MAGKTATLYELTDELLALDALLEETEGELTEELEQWMDEYGAKTREKVDRVCAYHADLLARAAAKKAEAKTLAEKARIEENKAERVKRLLDVAMTRLGTRQLDGNLYTVRRQKVGGKRKLTVLAADVSAFPKRFVIQPPPPPPVVDTEALRAFLEECAATDALADTEPVEYEPMTDGVVLARLEPRGESVRIK